MKVNELVPYKLVSHLWNTISAVWVHLKTAKKLNTCFLGGIPMDHNASKPIKKGKTGFLNLNVKYIFLKFLIDMLLKK